MRPGSQAATPCPPYRYGYEVNHQYEKSFRAERAFNAFMREHISPSLHYFSGLQHMTELEIAQRFAAACADKYLHLIISCNWATDDDWCVRGSKPIGRGGVLCAAVWV